MVNSTVVVTGASGFIGSALCVKLLRSGFKVRALIRNKSNFVIPAHNNLVTYRISNIFDPTDLTPYFSNSDVVIHCAGWAGGVGSQASDCEGHSEFTKLIANVAVSQGIKRLIFLSSVKVNGDQSFDDAPFNEFTGLYPEDDYARSKVGAETGLLKVASQLGLDVVILRLPVVYGPGVKGNFRSLVRLVSFGFPLPFASVDSNRRSLLALDNLLDLISICIDHPKAANQIFYVSDGEDFSTAELLSRIGQAINRPARLFRVPTWLLRAIASLLGKEALSKRLLGSLQVDIAKTRSLLDWSPSASIDDSMRGVMGEKRDDTPI